MKWICVAGAACLLFACGPVVNQDAPELGDASSSALTVDRGNAPAPPRCTSALLKFLPKYCDAFFPHATTACKRSSCVMTGCQSGYGNCDGANSNGCETNLLADPSNCGACGSACPAPDGAIGICTNGECAGYTCKAGYTDCNGSCVDLLHDAKHCGSCDNACSTYPYIEACEASYEGSYCMSICEEPSANCDGDVSNGCEANLAADANNCGSCGNVCHGATNATGICRAGWYGGECDIQCKPGYTRCGEHQCADVSSDPNNCGDCDRHCAPGPNDEEPQCIAGECSYGYW